MFDHKLKHSQLLCTLRHRIPTMAIYRKSRSMSGAAVWRAGHVFASLFLIVARPLAANSASSTTSTSTTSRTTITSTTTTTTPRSPAANTATTHLLSTARNVSVLASNSSNSSNSSNASTDKPDLATHSPSPQHERTSRLLHVGRPLACHVISTVAKTHA